MHKTLLTLITIFTLSLPAVSANAGTLQNVLVSSQVSGRSASASTMAPELVGPPHLVKVACTGWAEQDAPLWKRIVTLGIVRHDRMEIAGLLPEPVTFDDARVQAGRALVGTQPYVTHMLTPMIPGFAMDLTCHYAGITEHSSCSDEVLVKYFSAEAK
jgi:hypothetical protein